MLAPNVAVFVCPGRGQFAERGLARGLAAFLGRMVAVGAVSMTETPAAPILSFVERGLGGVRRIGLSLDRGKHPKSPQG